MSCRCITAVFCILVALICLHLFYNGQLYFIDPDVAVCSIIALFVIGGSTLLFECIKKK